MMDHELLPEFISAIADTGTDFDQMIDKILKYNTDGYPWIKLDEPTDISTIREPGNYVIMNPVNAPYEYRVYGDDGVTQINNWEPINGPIICMASSVMNTFYVAVGVLGTILTSSDGEHWNKQTIGNQGFHCVRYLNGMYIAVGFNGVIATSSDAITWTLQSSGVINTLHDVAYGADRYVIVGIDIILTSIDCIHWSKTTVNGSNYALNSITYANGQFVAVAQLGMAAVSTNGITWKLRSTSRSIGLNSIIYAKNLYVTVGNLGYILTSSDTFTWTRRFDLAAETDGQLLSVAYGNNLFVAVGYPTLLITSPDGITWTKRIELAGYVPMIKSVVWDGTQFTAVGNAGTVITSPDGITWTKRPNANFEALSGTSAISAESIKFDILTKQDILALESNGSEPVDYSIYPGKVKSIYNYIAYDSTTGGEVWRQNDEESGWTKISSDRSVDFYDALYAKDMYVALHNSLGPFYSTDCINWTRGNGLIDSTYAKPIFIKFLNNKFYVGFNKWVSEASLSANVYASDDGITWTRLNYTIETDTNYNAIAGIAIHGSKLIIFGNRRYSLSTDDGISWTEYDYPEIYSNSGMTTWRISYGGASASGFLIVGNVGDNNGGIGCCFSADGVLWEKVNWPTGSIAEYGTSLLPPCTFNGKCMLYANRKTDSGKYEFALHSTVDGITWQLEDLSITAKPSAIHVIDGLMFIRIPKTFYIHVSTDGYTIEKIRTPYAAHASGGIGVATYESMGDVDYYHSANYDAIHRSAEGRVNFIFRGPNQPVIVNTDTLTGYAWLNTSNNSINFMVRRLDTHEWVRLHYTNEMEKPIYDPTGKATNPYKYTMDQFTALNEELADWLKHKSNELERKHIIAADRESYNSKVTQAELTTWTDETKTGVDTSIDEKFEEKLHIGQIETGTDDAELAIDRHAVSTMELFTNNGTRWTLDSNLNAKLEGRYYKSATEMIVPTYIFIDNNQLIVFYTYGSAKYGSDIENLTTIDTFQSKSAICSAIAVNDKYIAFSSDYDTYYIADKTNILQWTEHHTGYAPFSSSTNMRIFAYNFKNKIYLFDSARRVLVSSDGCITWSEIAISKNCSSDIYSACEWNGKLYCAGNNAILVTSDGITWEVNASVNFATSCCSIIATDSYLAIPLQMNCALISTDGITWTMSTNEMAVTQIHKAFLVDPDTDLFLGFTSSGVISMNLGTSGIDASYYKCYTPSCGTINCVMPHESFYYIGGSTKLSKYDYHQNTVKDLQYKFPVLRVILDMLTDASWSFYLHASVGLAVKIDKNTKELSDAGLSNYYIRGFSFINDSIVAYGYTYAENGDQYGLIAISTDLTNTWTIHTTNIRTTIFSVNYFNNAYFVTAPAPDLGIFRSTDCEHFTKCVDIEVVNRTLGVGNGKMIALKKSKTIIWSQDGVTWNDADMHNLASVPTNAIILYGNGIFIWGYNLSIYLYSNDGIHWNKIETKVNASVWDAVYVDGYFYYIGMATRTLRISASDPTQFEIIDKDTLGFAYPINTRAVSVMNSHITPDTVARFDSKALENHTHKSDDKIEIDASKIKTGILDEARLPNEVTKQKNLEFITVPDSTSIADAVTARFGPTATNPPATYNGNRICFKRADDSTLDEYPIWYFVNDVSVLYTDTWESGIVDYTNRMGKGNIDWADIEGAPTTLDDYGITDAHSKMEIDYVIRQSGGMISSADDTADGVNATADSVSEAKYSEVFLDGYNIDVFDEYSGTVFIADVSKYIDRPTYKLIYADDISTGRVIEYECTPFPVKKQSYETYAEWEASTTDLEGNSGLTKSMYIPNDGFMICGWNAFLASSDDGITWTTQTSEIRGHISTINYANGKYVISSSAGDIFTSSDGITWIAGSGGARGAFSANVYGNNYYMLVNSLGIGVRSSDGLTWTDIKTIPIYKGSIADMIYVNGKFIGVGGSGLITLSETGEDWSLYYSSDTRTLTSVIYANGLYVAVGIQFALVTSPDGITWTTRPNPMEASSTVTFYDIIYANGLYVIVGTSGVVLISENLNEWSHRINGISTILMSVAYANGLYVIVGHNATILTSPDGITWTKQSIDPTTTTNLNRIVVGPGNTQRIAPNWKSATIPLTVAESVGHSDAEVPAKWKNVIKHCGDDLCIKLSAADVIGSSVKEQTDISAVGITPKDLMDHMLKYTIPSSYALTGDGQFAFSSDNTYWNKVPIVNPANKSKCTFNTIENISNSYIRLYGKDATGRSISAETSLDNLDNVYHPMVYDSDVSNIKYVSSCSFLSNGTRSLYIFRYHTDNTLDVVINSSGGFGTPLWTYDFSDSDFVCNGIFAYTNFAGILEVFVYGSKLFSIQKANEVPDTARDISASSNANFYGAYSFDGKVLFITDLGFQCFNHLDAQILYISEAGIPGKHIVNPNGIATSELFYLRNNAIKRLVKSGDKFTVDTNFTAVTLPSNEKNPIDDLLPCANGGFFAVGKDCMYHYTDSAKNYKKLGQYGNNGPAMQEIITFEDTVDLM